MRSATSLKFLRAGKQRLNSAGVLLENGMNLDSMYLAGYAVECALKALILARRPRGREEEFLADYCCGTKGHSLESLKAVLKDAGCSMPWDVAEKFRKVVGWTTDLRYEVGLKGYNEASGFVDAARAVTRWVERSL